MNPLTLYVIGASIITLIALFVIFYFLHYRFRGDRTILIVFSFIFLFIAEVVVTLNLFDPSALIP